MKAVVKTHELFISGYIPYFVNMEAAVKTHELFISGNIPYVINPFRKNMIKIAPPYPRLNLIFLSTFPVIISIFPCT
jgi:hypothetical protein